MLADPSRSTFASAREGSRHFAMMCLAPWVAKLQRAFAQSALSTQFRLVIDLGDLLRADPEARWGPWQKARQAGVLSPNDVRREEGGRRRPTRPLTASNRHSQVEGGRPAGWATCASAAAAERRREDRPPGRQEIEAWQRLT
jgi:phage portal protein BeeE